MTTFDYRQAVSELEKLLRQVEDPETSLEDIDECIKKADALVKDCRNYLRSARESLV